MTFLNTKRLFYFQFDEEELEEDEDHHRKKKKPAHRGFILDEAGQWMHDCAFVLTLLYCEIILFRGHNISWFDDDRHVHEHLNTWIF